MKIMKLTLVLIFILFVVPFLILLYSWRTPRIPNYTVGYFPFHIMFAIDYEIFSIEDTVRVQFKRSLRGNLMMQARRDWTTKLENNDRHWFVLVQRDEGNIEFIAANGSYLMGDPFSGNRLDERNGEIGTWMTWRFATRNASGRGFLQLISIIFILKYLAQSGQ